VPTKRLPEVVPAAASPGRPLGGPLFGTPILTIVIAALAVLLPTFFLGIPSGHDFEFHMNSWMEVLSQWRLGILYPRWADLAHYGYGEARFIFYPPTSWMLGAALGSFLPWKIVPGVYEWIALTLSGCSMFLLARRFLQRRDAVFAAALYAANPYHIVIVYWRSALAELLAGALLPLLVLVILRPEKNARKTILLLALIVAAAWLTNIPSAIMLTYSMALLQGTAAIMRRSLGPLAIGATAMVAGLALAAFYIVPVLHEQSWVEIAQVLSPGVRPQDNFIFTSLANDPDHNRFNLLISLLSVTEIILLALAAFMSRDWRTRAPELWWMLTAWSAGCAFLLSALSLLLYRFLPEFRYVQLPLRWLLCLNVGFALLVTMASRRWLVRALACLAMLTVLAVVWHRVLPPWWDDAGDIAEMEDNQETGAGYEGIDEYVPTGADAYEIKKDTRRATFDGNGSSRIRITQWGPESKSFTANVNQPGQLVVKLFKYPAWEVEVNNHTVQTGALEVNGQMTIPVEAGDNHVRITFVRTSDREIGGFLSLGTGTLLLGVIFFDRRTARLSTL
jgi:hypothetical protein